MTGRRHSILRSRRDTQFIWPFNQMEVGDFADVVEASSQLKVEDNRYAMRRISGVANKVGKPRGWRFSCHLLRGTNTIRCRRIL